MKKIVISLAIVGVVTGITLGITGAFWTDQGTSTNQSFKSGTLNLQLSNTGTGGWGDVVNQTWNVNKMTPGGTPYVSTLYIRNRGSVDADYLKFTLANTPDPAGMDRRMRITELKYKGESLLTGGAGADLSSYVAPTNCDINVHPGTYQKITDAITNANNGNVICVGPGNYTFAWEGSVVDVNVGVTIASTDGPDSTTISAGVKIDSDDAVLTGFTITDDNQPSPILFASGQDVVVSYNKIIGSDKNGGGRGIEFYTGGNFANSQIVNNVISNVTSGIYTNPHSGVIDIKYNSISNTMAGIGGATVADIQLNDFSNNDEAIGFDNSYWLAHTTVERNNFDGEMVNDYGATVTVNAQNNWWGDFNPSDQVTGNVDYSPYAGGPFIGYINGQDPYANGFADLDDFEHSIIVFENPGLQINGGNYRALRMGVQLDGPTTGNTFMDGNVGMDMTVTMGQGPAQ